MNTVWLIGVNTSMPMVSDAETWMCEGVFESEENAVLNCRADEFVAEVEVGKRLPEKAKDVICLYWPYRETKEDGLKRLEQLRKE